ncbi:acetyltransferase component of pyruvate dehydrogenase complex [Sphaerisporangium krabiense]|uniref:Dihydrolipoamide acetyltransferase component of pyruvate dehydrogenase complex n=1 Tax=Sphaerisporangium krabiense TaxID=763782 RepID=A0A7W9DNA6_9ACTN|nr:2-oxo acid dehydrogenase subunit E2 [Sphaerisporangium krabiense]MBB5625148.1 pyruvate dehydrogenase E2 component (dihydrolipoamide acetyltransferase) [Sphaerisporangium krabiense]GII64343.1 acetyltransferase component of pyruvate dehydrogenase complex [Sphaerisporangium krabiense]
MPEVSANAVEAVLQEWQIEENMPFSADDTIATVETEKAVVDVEAEADGVLLKTLVPAGSTIEVGAPIAVLGEPGEKIDDVDALLAHLRVALGTAVPAPERRTVPEPARPDPPMIANGGTATVRRVFASPLARRLARDAHLSVDQIRGTGPGGRIIRRDVETAVAVQADRAATAAPTSSTGTVPATAPVTPTPGDRPSAGGRPAYVDRPHSRIRKAIAARLTASKQTTPHFYLRGTAHADKLLKLRARLNEVSPTKISVNDMVIKAAAAAHLLVPAMNVVWTPDAIRSFSTVDISVAIATEQGLVTPVLRSVERLSISQVAAGVQDFAQRAKAGRLRQDELEGGSLSITNLGMYGTEEFDAIINPPQAAILAVGAARQEPVVTKGRLTVGTVIRVTLSVDHRPVDGVVAAQWMKAFVSLVENPLRTFV